jgi:hypothetical protein
MTQYKSVIIWYHRENFTVIDQSIDTFLKETMKGLKKIIAQKKLSEIIDVEEGKTKLSFTGYVELRRYMLRMKSDG